MPMPAQKPSGLAATMKTPATQKPMKVMVTPVQAAGVCPWALPAMSCSSLLMLWGELLLGGEPDAHRSLSRTPWRAVSQGCHA